MVWHFDNSSFNLHYQLSWLTKFSQSYATNQNIWNISTILTRIMNGLCFIIAQMHLRPPLFIWKIKFVLKITKAWGNYYFLYWLPNWTTNFFATGDSYQSLVTPESANNLLAIGSSYQSSLTPCSTKKWSRDEKVLSELKYTPFNEQTSCMRSGALIRALAKSSLNP